MYNDNKNSDYKKAHMATIFIIYILEFNYFHKSKNILVHRCKR